MNKIIKNLIAVLYAVLAVLVVVKTVVVPDAFFDFNVSDIPAVGYPLAIYFVLVCAVLSYGFYKARRYVIKVHLGLLCVVAAIYLFVQAFGQMVSADLLTVSELSSFILTLGILAAIQIFIFVHRKSTFTTEVHKGPGARLAVIMLSAVPMGALAASTALSLFMVTCVSNCGKREQVSAIENNRFRVTEYYYCNCGIFDPCFTTLVLVDKQDPEGKEEELWYKVWERPQNYRFLNDSTLIIVTDSLADAVEVDLIDP